MKIPLYQVDAFANKLFAGNPAAVCILESWLEDTTLLAIAAENNLAETAFITQNTDQTYNLRWFTPSIEMPLCGHATLAAGYVLYEYYNCQDQKIRFHSKSGELLVFRDDERLILDFPAYNTEPAVLTDDIVEALGTRPKEFLRSGVNYYAIYEDEEQVRTLDPDYSFLLDIMKGTDILGFVPTARALDYDFVSRYLAPEAGTNITEDPVTGSIHSVLVPLWASRLGRNKLNAYQASKRGGELFCELREIDGVNRSLIGGCVKPYLEGCIEV